MECATKSRFGHNGVGMEEVQVDRTSFLMRCGWQVFTGLVTVMLVFSIPVDVVDAVAVSALPAWAIFAMRSVAAVVAIVSWVLAYRKIEVVDFLWVLCVLVSVMLSPGIRGAKAFGSPAAFWLVLASASAGALLIFVLQLIASKRSALSRDRETADR